MANICSISGVPRMMDMYTRATSASGLNLLIRANATSMPSGSDPTSVKTKICRLTTKPWPSMPAMVRRSTRSPFANGAQAPSPARGGGACAESVGLRYARHQLE